MDNYKKIVKTTLELEAKRNAELAEVNETLAKARAELEKATAVLELTDDQKEYDGASETIKKAKTTITLANRKYKSLDVYISEDEFDDARVAVKSEYDIVRRDATVNIFDALRRLIILMEDYEGRIKELETVDDKLRSLRGVPATRKMKMSVHDLSATDDPCNWLANFVAWYSLQKMRNDTLRHHGLLK